MISLAMSMLVAAAALSSDEVPAKVQAPSSVAAPANHPASQDALSDGIWPSERLTRSLLTRWADRISDQFELEPADREKVREATVERWGRFLKENRADLQPLFNEFLEMRLGAEAPRDEEVRRWADRALPVLERLEVQARETTGEFREMLPPEKSAQFEAEAIKLGLGLQAASEKLKQWKDGQYEPHEIWQAPQRERRTPKKQKEAETSAGNVGNSTEAPRAADDRTPAASMDPIAAELTRWDAFVRDVIKRYNYDTAQKSAAQSLLSELKARAIAHRDRYKSEIAELDQRIQNNTGSEEELAGIKADLVSLYGPIDAMFEELKTRVESVATTEQKIRAAEAKDTKAGRQNATVGE